MGNEMAGNGNAGRTFVTPTILEGLLTADNSSKFELISKIWPKSDLSSEEFEDDLYTAFTQYIREELSLLRDFQSKFAAESLDGTIDLIQVLRSNADKPQEAVTQLLRDRFKDVDDSAILRSLELATRLLLTINVRSERVAIGPFRKEVGTIEWTPELSLKDLVSSQLHADEGSTKKSSPAPLDQRFTAASLVNLCDVKISWTHNLADHLILDKKRRILTVYEHKICLLNHSKDTNSLIPHSTVNEAIDTLNLLFPFGDGSTRALMEEEKKMPLYRLGGCDRPRMNRLTDYDIWRTKIADLVEVYNEPPKDIKQLLNDRRNLSNWMTTWLGILVLVLTVVSIVFGTVSTLYAIKQYELALAQACSASGAAQLLPKYCG